MDLMVSVFILFCLSRHLEKRWGSRRFFVVYVLSGIGGNIFGTFLAPSAISVGSGGCIFGMLGAMHSEMILLILHQHYNEGCSYDHIDDEQDDELVLPWISNNNKDEMEDDKSQGANSDADADDDVYFFHSTLIVLGFLVGIVLTTVMGIFFPDSPRMSKDWSVLYGGMISGMVIGVLWHFCTSFLVIEEERRRTKINLQVLCVMLLLLIPILLDCFFT